MLEPLAAKPGKNEAGLAKLEGPAAPPLCEDGACQALPNSLGTALQWAPSPMDACREAAEQDKLVFLIHVSGNFEIPGFT